MVVKLRLRLERAWALPVARLAGAGCRVLMRRRASGRRFTISNYVLHKLAGVQRACYFRLWLLGDKSIKTYMR